MKEWPIEAERAFWRGACAPSAGPASLFWFVRIAWGAEWYFRSTGKPRWLQRRVHFPFLTWLATHLLKWLEARRAGIMERLYLMILLPRGFGKTLGATKAAALWLHLADRNSSWYIGSETHPKAKTFLASVKAIMDGKDDTSWFTWLYGRFTGPRTWSAESAVTAFRSATSLQEPTFGTYGTETSVLTGMHPDGITYDDPTALETLSDLTLAAARESYDSNHPVLRSDSCFIGVMTRYAENDAAGYIMNQEGIATWSGAVPPTPDLAKMVGKGKVHVYFLQGRDHANKSDEHPKGTPVLPEVWDKAGMDHYELKDPVNFAAQIENTPTVGEHMPLEYAQLEHMLISRDDLPAIDFATIHLDTAFKDEKQMMRGDWNVIAGVLHGLRDDGRVYIDRIIRNTTDRSEHFISRLSAYMMSLQARGIRIKVITDEAEAWGKKGSFKQLLYVSLSMAGHRIGPDSILTFNRSNKKPTRLRKAAAYWAEGYVRIIKGIEWEDRLKYEMVNLDKGDHDDITDALSDIWQDKVWKKPQPTARGGDVTPMQPGDEVLRPALHWQLSQDLREQRRAEYDPNYTGESEQYGVGNDPY